VALSSLFSPIWQKDMVRRWPILFRNNKNWDGHLPRPAERALVTAAQRLRVSDLTRAGVFARPGQIRFVPLAPVESLTNLPLLACSAVPSIGGFSLALAHHTHHPRAAGQIMRYRVGIEETPRHFGGVRYWFVCPGENCPHALREPGYLREDGRGEPSTQWRATALYLPPGALQFRCRDCHRLTYRTKQLHYDSSRPKSRPSPAPKLNPHPTSALLSVGVAREQLLRCLQDTINALGEAQGEERPMEQPEPTLRQQAVWYLWGVRRVPVEELAQLFGVTPRTICRDLAALRARGWRRPRAKEAPADIGLDLIVQARAQLHAAFAGAYEELFAQGKRSHLKETLASLQQGAMKDAELVLSASQLVRATEQAQSSQHPQEVEIMKQELAAVLATMLGR